MENMMEDRISMVHGSGGAATSELIEAIFAKEFKNDTLDQMEDSAVVAGNMRLAVTTDSFVVTPMCYPGGNIGRLCICGTVNDLLMRGAVPKYITCGFILQEGMEVSVLQEIVHAMAETAKEAGVRRLPLFENSQRGKIKVHEPILKCGCNKIFPLLEKIFQKALDKWGKRVYTVCENEKTACGW